MLATFSLHSVVNSVGAIAGLASLVGLALLILLYFAQARELRRLSDWVQSEEQRRRSMPAPAPVIVPRQPAVAAGGPPVRGPMAAPPPVAPGAAVAVTTAVPGVRRVAVPAPGGPRPGPATAVAASAVIGPATAAAATIAGGVSLSRDAGGDAAGVAEPEGPPASPAPVDPRTGAAAPLPTAAGAARERAQGAEELARDDHAGALEGDPSPPGGAPPARDVAEPAVGAAATAAQAPTREELETIREAAAASAAAVPLMARRIPAAEPLLGVGGAVEGGPGTGPGVEAPTGASTTPGTASVPAAARSPFDLLRTDPPKRVEEAPAAMALGPATAAGSRPRFPPHPPSSPSGPRQAEPPGAPAAAVPEPTIRRPADAPSLLAGIDDPPPRHLGAMIRLVVAAVVIVAILIVIVTQVFGGGSPAPTSSRTHSSVTQGAGSHSRAASPPAPSSVRVAVLNGTLTSGLAMRGWRTLAARGFREGAIADAPVQAHMHSFIGYTSGHRAAGIEVARDLSISTSRVGPVDAATLAAAESSGSTPQVVVTLGADYAAR